MFARASTLILAVATTFASATSALAIDNIGFQLSWIPSGQFAPYFVGENKGFYKEEGISIDVRKGSGSGEAVRRVAAGAAEFGDADISSVMLGFHKEKTGVKCIMRNYTRSPHSIFVLESSGIKDMKGLEGKRVGTTAGNSHQVFFPLLAKMNNIDASKVSWVTVDPTAMGALLLKGEIDAAPQFETNYFYQNKAAEAQGKKIKVLPYADYGFKIYSICVHTSDKIINEKPDLVKRFLRATKKSFEWTNANQKEAAKIYNSVHPMSAVDDVEAEIKLMMRFVFNDDTNKPGFGLFDATQLKKTYEIVADSQGLDPKADPAAVVDTRFVPK